MTTTIYPGDAAPDFGLPAADSSPDGGSGTFRLADHAGRRVALCFYPGEDPPAAQQQLAALRDAWTSLSATGVLLIAICDAAVPAQQKTLRSLGLPFALLSDEQNAVAKAYGIWIDSGGGGDVEGGSLTRRTTFVVDPAGKIEQVLREERPARHVEALLALLHG